MFEARGLSISVLTGVAAGLVSGLFGVGGGVVMVPMLVAFRRFDQHRAHVNSLAGGLVVGVAGSAVYGAFDHLQLKTAALLAAGALVGAPLGAATMRRMTDARLKAAFGAMLVAVAVVMVVL